jgi:hypothetical protein
MLWRCPAIGDEGSTFGAASQKRAVTGFRHLSLIPAAKCVQAAVSKRALAHQGPWSRVRKHIAMVSDLNTAARVGAAATLLRLGVRRVILHDRSSLPAHAVVPGGGAFDQGGGAVGRERQRPQARKDCPKRAKAVPSFAACPVPAELTLAILAWRTTRSHCQGP